MVIPNLNLLEYAHIDTVALLPPLTAGGQIC